MLTENMRNILFFDMGKNIKNKMYLKRKGKIIGIIFCKTWRNKLEFRA